MNQREHHLLVYDEKLKQARAYWLDRLATPLTPATLSRDGWSNNAAAERVSRPIVLDGETCRRLFEISNNSLLLIYTTLVAAVQICLYRYSGERRIVIGSPARRQQDGAQVDNALPIVVDLHDDLTARQMLALVRQALIEAYTHQNFPYDHLLQELPWADPSGAGPLFDVAVSLDGLHAPLPDAGQSIVLAFTQQAERLSGSVQFDAGRFEPSAVEHFTNSFGTILAAMLAEPTRAVKHLPLVTADQRAELLRAWRDTVLPYDLTQAVTAQIEAQAQQTPTAIAVICGDKTLTYRELNQQANRLARYLQRVGAAPRTPIALCVERSLDVVVAMLGILKMGGIYLPLDAAYPQKRLELLLEDASVQTIVTQQHLAGRFPGTVERIVGMDSDAAAIAQEAPDNLDTTIYPDDLAYIIYTSGSTGQPKGVCTAHGVAAAHFRAIQRAHALTPDDGVLLFASFSFDMSIEQTFPTLYSGARLVMRDSELWSPAQLLRMIGEQRITVINLPTAYWQQLVQEPSFGEQLARSGCLRLMLAGGEAMRPAHARQWQQATPIRLFNAYGPTETAITSTLFELPPNFGEHSSAASVPIGFPICHRVLYVLDHNGEPCPPGVIGELFIGGPLLAQGYLNRPDLTAERFVPDPFAPTTDDRRPTTDDRPIGTDSPAHQLTRSPAHSGGQWSVVGGRMYRTGDIARYLPNGAVQFLGRADNQVKIRGFRIELGEVEAALAHHPLVHESVAAIQESDSGEKRLVAYVVPTTDDRRPTTEDRGLKIEDSRLDAEAELSSILHPPSSTESVVDGQWSVVGELRAFLKDRLPEYMVPAVFVVLDRLPLTASGKIDRLALPAPDAIRTTAGNEAYDAPLTPVEQELACIWQDVLGVERVGRHDNFFELGGDSILCIQIVARAGQAQLQLSIKQIFLSPTIAELAPLVEQAGAQQEQTEAAGPVPLTPIQQHFIAQESPDPHHFNQALLLDMPIAPDPVHMREVVDRLQRHHDALRLRLEHTAEGMQQQIAPPADDIPFTWFDLAGLPEPLQRSTIEAEARRLQDSLDLAQGPIWRVVLFQRGATLPACVLIIIHHFAVDGVSWRILLEDMQQALQQRQRGEDIRLPARTTSFKRWSERLNAYARSPEAAAELDFWLAIGAGPIGSIPLDTTEERGTNTEASADTVIVALSAAETQTLLRDVPKAHHTQINDILLAALALAFQRWTGAADLLIDLEGHGREELFDDIDLSRTAGWFTSVYPVALHLAQPDSPGGTLRAVKEQLRSIPHHGIGYGLLRYLSGDPDIRSRLEALPQAQICFNYLGQFDRQISETAFFRRAQEEPGPARSPASLRWHLLNIDAIISGGQLQLMWEYSTHFHERATIGRLAEQCIDVLRGLIASCTDVPAGNSTPSDFPLAGLNKEQLDAILAQYEAVEDIYPLSPTQQGMLFHSLYTDGSNMYTVQMRYRLRGRVNVAAFERAWQHVMDRHPILRTALVWDGLDQPLQVVLRGVRLPFIWHDWRHLSPQAQERHLDALLDDDLHQPFELGQAPLMRLKLVQTGEQRFFFAWSHHHLLLDGWCQSLIMREFFACYEAFDAGTAPQLAEPRPYRRFIEWLQHQDQRAVETFWREMLAGYVPSSELGIGLAGMGMPEGARHEEQQCLLSPDITQAVRTLARQHNITLNTLVQGMWGLLLSFYSGRRDIVFGSVVSGRPPSLDGFESIVGLFINTLPVRARVNPAAATLPWLQDLQQQLATMQPYEHSSLAQIQSWSHLGRGQALFETFVDFANFPIDMAALKQFRAFAIEPLRPAEITHYPLTITAIPGEQLSLELNYACDRFDPATAARILTDLERLFEQFAAAPAGCLSDLLAVLHRTEHLQQRSSLQARRHTNQARLQQIRRPSSDRTYTKGATSHDS